MIFKEAHIEQEFKENGYVVLKSEGTLDVDKVLEFYENNHIFKGRGFYTTQVGPSSLKKATNNFLNEQFAPFIDKYLHDYKFLVGNYAIKEPGQESLLPFHQDWTVVDETKYSYLNIWCSLMDIDEHNGCLKLVPKSHKLERKFRSSSIPSSLKEKDLERKFLHLPTEKGDVVIWEGSLVHGSFPNCSEEQRLATTVIAVPKCASTFHYYFNSEKSILEKFQIVPSFFFNFDPLERPNVGANLVDQLDLPAYILGGKNKAEKFSWLHRLLRKYITK